MDTNAELLKNYAVKNPSVAEITQISEDLRLKCDPEEINSFHEFMRGTTKAYQRVYELVEPSLPVKYPRTPGHRDEEDPAWYWRCDIKGADTGILAGKTVGIKDNVAVAGVPMMNGSKLLEGYTPEYDATIVTRILDAGGRIIGKTTCEDLCVCGSSWTPSTGVIPHPLDPMRTAGGSSGGSASLVARGLVDMAIGGDQGGSIRTPASWCGVVGLKPTHGLVPYTGAMPIELTIDHVGPIAKTVTDCALLLEAIAGYDDGTDPRQPPNLNPPKYSELVNADIKGKRIGILCEGFNECDEDVVSIVREAANRLSETGAIVEQCSIPLQNDAFAIWIPIGFDGAYNQMVKGNGFGMNWKGWYSLSLQEALTRGYNLRPHDFSITGKFLSVFCEYMSRNHQNKYYAKAQNLNRNLTKAYNEALEKYDVLVLPTLPKKAFPLPTTKSSIIETLELSMNMLRNAAPFNATGHPVLTVNAGFSEDRLPIGMSIVGRHFDEVTVLQIGRAFEQQEKKIYKS